MAVTELLWQRLWDKKTKQQALPILNIIQQIINIIEQKIHISNIYITFA